MNPYTGPWTKKEAAHLLRRTLFGPSTEEIETAVSLGLDATLDLILDDYPMPEPPLNYRFGSDQDVPIGQTWVEAPSPSGVQGYRRNSLRYWWTGLILNREMSIREKMTLFWHNHFALQLKIVKFARYVYHYNDLLRTHALGNFKTLVQEITRSPAILVYLNGNTNISEAPNENYARELFELFTIGKGPITGPGDYTHYTEDDVVAAAKVLTGWEDSGRFEGGVPSSVFHRELHTEGDKQFSHRFGNRVVSQKGREEYLDLIDMVFEQKEAARYICRKLYRWFVFYEIDEATESTIIEPMADLLIADDFEVKAVVRALLASTHFFEDARIGAMIKSPVDYVVGLVRQFRVEFPDPIIQLKAVYQLWGVIFAETEKEQMPVFDPPAVAGWPAYYQEPQYYRSWVNAVTLPGRKRFAESMFGTGYLEAGERIRIDPLKWVQSFELATVTDPGLLIPAIADQLFPRPITTAQTDYLREVLLQGLPDYEWTVEYLDYINEPADPEKSEPVSIKLRQLLIAMVSLAEYQLS